MLEVRHNSNRKKKYVSNRGGCKEEPVMKNFINGGYCHRGKIFYVLGNFLRKRLYFCIRKGMRFWEKDCLCPVKSPICTCNKIKEAKIINRKVIVPSKDEIVNNSRCKSAKLRICEKV